MRGRIMVMGCLLAVLGAPRAGSGRQGDTSGMIDLHLHVTPESRGVDGTNALQAAQLAKVFGLRAILLKNHDTETASHAYLVRQVVSGIEVYGGIVLNRSVGGINPAAVERMVAATGGFGRIVWLPTLDSEHSASGADIVPTRETESFFRMFGSCSR